MDGKDTITDFYVKPYNRCQPYLIGILVGYVLFKMKDKKIRIPWVRALTYVLLTFEYMHLKDFYSLPKGNFHS